MKTLFYSTKDFEYPYIVAANHAGLDLQFTPVSLSFNSADQAEGCDAVSIFAGDDASAPVLKELRSYGVKYIALRSAGYDNIDLKVASALGFTIAFVPDYSPNAIAEHAVALMLALSRHLVHAHDQLRRNDFILNGLVGFNLQGKKVGIIGTGRIGSVVAKILHGFDCDLLGYDIAPDETLVDKFGLQYTSLKELCSRCNIITLHIPLDKHTRYLVDDDFLEDVQSGTMLINTSRGMVVKTTAVLNALDDGILSAFGLDVYENEREIFFTDRRTNPPEDEVLRRLMRMPNVLLTPHQAFATKEALQKIAESTIYNLECFDSRTPSIYQLSPLTEIEKNNKNGTTYMLC